MSIRVHGCGSNAILQLPGYSPGQACTYVPIASISTWSHIDYNGIHGTRVLLVSGREINAGCWPEDIARAMAAAHSLKAGDAE